MWGKVSRFFSSPPSYIHGFSTLQNSYERFNKSFAFLTWILLKTVNSILGNGREYITDVCVQISHFPGWPCSHRKRKATVEVSPRWNRSLTASLLASTNFISWQKPARFFTITVPDVNFQCSRSLAGKTSCFTNNPWKPRKFSHRETFVAYSISTMCLDMKNLCIFLFDSMHYQDIIIERPNMTLHMSPQLYCITE